MSFNGNKIMTTSGGGMLLTPDADLANHVRYLSTQARQPVAHYEHTDIGYNYRLSNILAALGRAQLTRLDQMMVQRRRWRERYREIFGQTAGVRILGGDDDAADNCWLTAIIVDPREAGWSTSELVAALAAEHIETRPVWKPMHLQPVFRDAPGLINGVSERLFENGLTLPSGSAMTVEQMDRVADFLDRFLRARG